MVAAMSSALFLIVLTALQATPTQSRPAGDLTRMLNGAPPATVAPATAPAASAPAAAPAPSSASGSQAPQSDAARALADRLRAPAPAASTTATTPTAPAARPSAPVATPAAAPVPRPAVPAAARPPVTAPRNTPTPAAPPAAAVDASSAALPPAAAPPAPAPVALDARAVATLPFTVELPTGFTITAGRPGPDFNVYTIRRGGQPFVMVYTGPASQFPIYSGEMIEAGGRASVVATEEGRRMALEHLFSRTTEPREIHVWITSLDGADRVLAERIGQSIDDR
jgi:hypothetical protein